MACKYPLADIWLPSVGHSDMLFILKLCFNALIRRITVVLNFDQPVNNISKICNTCSVYLTLHIVAHKTDKLKVCIEVL